MNKESIVHNRFSAIITQLSSWIERLEFNPATGKWEGCLKPTRIIKVFDLNDFIIELERHVITEIIEIVGDALNTDVTGIKNKNKNRELADVRAITAILIYRHFGLLRQINIYRLLGWRNRCSFPSAVKLAELREINEKIEKIYRAYPSLREGKIEIVAL